MANESPSSSPASFVNHPNNSAASLADLDAALWLDADTMIVVNPDGTKHHYVRVGGEMMPLGPVRNLGYVAAADPLDRVKAQRPVIQI